MAIKYLNKTFNQLELAEEILNSKTKELNLSTKMKKKIKYLPRKDHTFTHKTRIKF